MKRRVTPLLSTISTAALTAALGMPAAVAAPSAETAAPIHRLNTIRDGYLAALASEQAQGGAKSAEEVAQFRNFPNFPNFSNWRNG